MRLTERPSTPLLLYCQHAVLVIELYGSAVSVAPDLDATFSRFVLNRLFRLAPERPDLVGGHACPGLTCIGRFGGRCSINERRLWCLARIGGHWCRLPGERTRGQRPERVDRAGEILVERRPILGDALEDLRGGRQGDQQSSRDDPWELRHDRFLPC